LIVPIGVVGTAIGLSPLAVAAKVVFGVFVAVITIPPDTLSSCSSFRISSDMFVLLI